MAHLFGQLQVFRKLPSLIDQLLELLAQPQDLLPDALLLCLCSLYASVMLRLLLGILNAEEGTARAQDKETCHSAGAWL